MTEALEHLQSVVTRYGEEAALRALESTPIMAHLDADAQHAVAVAIQALTCGNIQGMLVFQFPGHPGAMAAATFVSGPTSIRLDPQAPEGPPT